MVEKDLEEFEPTVSMIALLLSCHKHSVFEVKWWQGNFSAICYVFVVRSHHAWDLPCV